jgi:hypothetical protein
MQRPNGLTSDSCFARCTPSGSRDSNTLSGTERYDAPRREHPVTRECAEQRRIRRAVTQIQGQILPCRESNQLGGTFTVPNVLLQVCGAV